MPRPPKPKDVELEPRVTYLKPAGVPLRELEEVVLAVEEVEALRLKDMVGLDQEECAGRMGVSQSTFQRTLAAARGKVTRAIVEGFAIRVEGGHYRVVGPGRCHGASRHRHRRRGGGPGEGEN